MSGIGGTAIAITLVLSLVQAGSSHKQQKQLRAFMPSVRILVARGKPIEYLRAIDDGLHQALVETMNVPRADRIQVLAEHEKDTLIFDHTFLKFDRSEDLIIV